MNYMTPQEASEKWGICLRQVQELCSKNRIPGVRKINRRWFIPLNAIRPEDGRINRNKASEETGAYHFPIFLYSDYCSSGKDLSPEEQELFKAQILTIQTEYSKSVKICRNLYEAANMTSVRFGALCTNVFNYAVLGQYSEISICMEMMKKIIEKEVTHKEDYNFLIKACYYHYSSNPNQLLKIDASKLSADAVIAYECAIMETTVLYSSAETVQSIQIYNALCRQMEDAGILPAALLAHGVLAMLYAHINDKENTDLHAAKACKIGYENKYIKLLSKYSVFLSELYDKHLSEYSNEFAKRVAEIRQNNLNGWKLTYNTMSNSKALFNHTSTDSEYLLLIYYGMTNKKIAELKNISMHKLNTILKRLCTEAKCENRAQLVQYTRQLMH